MAQKNEDFKNMSYVGEFTYLDLDRPRKFNINKNEYESFEPESGIGTYSVCWTLSAEDGDAFIQACKSHFATRKKHNKKIGEFGKVHCVKENDDGTYLVSAKLNASDQQGKPRTPNVIDKSMRTVVDRSFEGGTKGAIKFSISPQPNPSTNKWGISAFMQAVQIREAVYVKEDPDGIFINEPADEDDAKDPFGLPDLNKEKQSASVNDLEDEIPF